MTKPKTLKALTVAVLIESLQALPPEMKVGSLSYGENHLININENIPLVVWYDCLYFDYHGIDVDYVGARQLQVLKAPPSEEEG